ncbi:MAG: helix-turn-helix domain-containing protein [Cytophagales bacterium]|nr:helix-turn-helix domain-containing protein [Cytophagales bacterium]
MLEKETAILIKDLRIKSGFTQEQLAGLLDCDPHYIYYLEKGKRKPSLAMAFNLAKAFQMKPSALITLLEVRLGID